jgi:orotidine-5'-phosphate decarboxylase
MGNVTATPIVALDVPDLNAALRLVDRLGDSCDFYKVGGELFTAEGPRAVEALRARGPRVFLDVKLHDIPNTVRGAVRSAARMGANLVTVHASGGTEMLRAAQAGAGADCGVLAVSVLTSLDAAALGELWGRESVDVAQEVVRLAQIALGAGLHGLVCGGDEIGAVRSATEGRLAVLVPGIRFREDKHHDQRRVVTPFDAAARGARYLVLGRAVTAATDPAAAMHMVREEIERAERVTTA